MHLWEKGIQVYTNKGPFPFPKRDYCKIVKIHWQLLKIFFLRTAEPISTKLCIKHPWMKGIQVYSNEEPINSHKVNKGFFFFKQRYDIIISVYWFELFFSGPSCLLFRWLLMQVVYQINNNMIPLRVKFSGLVNVAV